MAGRIRTIKPEVLEDEVAQALSHAAWRLWVSMWVMADDAGRLPASPGLLAARVFWAQPADVPALLAELEAAEMIKAYQVNGQAFATISGFRKHQRINRPSGAKYPAPGDGDSPESSVNAHDPSVNAHGGLTEDSVRMAQNPAEPRKREPDSKFTEGSLRDLDREHDLDRESEREIPARAPARVAEARPEGADAYLGLANSLLGDLEAGKAELRSGGMKGPGTRSVGVVPPAAAILPIKELVAELAGNGRGLDVAEQDLRHHLAVELADAKLKRDASYLTSMWSAKRVLASLARDPGQPLGRSPSGAAAKASTSHSSFKLFGQEKTA